MIFKNPDNEIAQTILQNYPDLKSRDFFELSNSSKQSAKFCMRKLEFRKLFGSAKSETSQPLSVGTAMHAGIQSYVAGNSREIALHELMLNFNFSFQTSPMDERGWQSCIHIATRAFDFWDTNMDEWEIAKIIDQNGNEIPAIEVPFALIYIHPQSSLKFKYIGYIDFILYNKIENKYYVVDLKTTTNAGDLTADYKFAEQCLPYGLVLETLLGHDITKGIDILYWTIYLKMLDTQNFLYPFTKSYADIQDWMFGFIRFADEIVDYLQFGWWSRRGNGCTAYYKPCYYLDVCELREIAKIKNFIMLDNMEIEENENAINRIERPKPWIEIELNSVFEQE